MNLQIQKRWVWIALLAIIVANAALRIRLLEVPLDRDEGGYAYIAQLILQGTPLFAGAYDIKMPGLYYFYALFLSLFGQTTLGVHLGLMVINAAAILLLCLIGKRLFGSVAGVMTAAAYAVMSLSQTVQGFSANAEPFMLPPALAGILLSLKAIDSNRKRHFFAAGLSLGLALIIKQQGIFFAGFAFIYLFLCLLKVSKNQWGFLLHRCLLFVLGLAIPLTFFSIYFWVVGRFDKLWFWVVEYPRLYVSLMPFDRGMGYLMSRVTQMAHSAIPLWILAAVGLLSLFCKKKLRCHILFISLFFAFSAAAIIPGYHFFSHYFVLALPAVALLAGLGVSSITDSLSNSSYRITKTALPILLAASAIAYAVFAEKAYLFELTPAEISKTTLGLHPFPESVVVADYIEKHSKPDDTIAVLGSEAQIFFYSHRHSATSYIIMYPLMGINKYAKSMQQEMVREIEAAKPRFLILVRIPTSWLIQEQSETLILRWFDEYKAAHYNLVGIVQILDDGSSIYHWDENIKTYQLQSNFGLRIFERK